MLGGGGGRKKVEDTTQRVIAPEGTVTFFFISLFYNYVVYI